MKPDAAIVMLQLITQIRTTFPFDQSEAQIRAGPCRGCSLKLLGFLESELDDWQARINTGERPGLAELSQLIQTSRKTGRALQKAGLMRIPILNLSPGSASPYPRGEGRGERNF